jgi:hypothetical protein
LISTGLGVKRGDSWLATLEKFGADSWWRFASLFVLVKTIEEGAATTVFCAVATEAAAESGLFYDNAKVLTGAYISSSVGMRGRMRMRACAQTMAPRERERQRRIRYSAENAD